MAKFKVEDKIRAVREYLTGHDSMNEVAKRYGVNKRGFHQWIELYQHHGVEGLMKRYTNYTPEFKMDVLNFMNDTGASPMKAAAVFNIPSRTTVMKWEKALDQSGMDALISKQRGHPSMKEKSKKPVSPKKPTESLQEEVERLRMENAYLKKLNALVKEKELSQRNSKRK
ncbi:transposase [Planococcus donghaensis]|uniref:Transposase n=1 Tax=Planococcus donghaensis TaxID=414778 RepID=A0A1C7EIU0_9BACL|nr:transposase [Planococcus donghaensis]ANU23262.1 transposase [Planococcus donghaensis]ANU23769.1 transposase [Planococcus donghaensis]